MQKNFAIAKISEEGRKEGRGEKEVSGLFVRGECARREEGGEGKCEERTACQLFGGGEGRVEDAATETEAAATAICSNLRFAATTMI